jgi:hypothetical protein
MPFGCRRGENDYQGRSRYDAFYRNHPDYAHIRFLTPLPTRCATSVLCEVERAQDASFMALTFADIAEPRPRTVFMALSMTFS